MKAKVLVEQNRKQVEVVINYSSISELINISEKWCKKNGFKRYPNTETLGIN